MNPSCAHGTKRKFIELENCYKVIAKDWSKIDRALKSIASVLRVPSPQVRDVSFSYIELLESFCDAHIFSDP
jgi:hypothetical protein